MGFYRIEINENVILFPEYFLIIALKQKPQTGFKVKEIKQKLASGNAQAKFQHFSGLSIDIGEEIEKIKEENKIKS